MNLRFAACHGNTVVLSDMGKDCAIWITDLDGKIRKRICGRDHSMRQPSGITFDADGNFLVVDSKCCRVLAFSPDGTYLSDVSFSSITYSYYHLQNKYLLLSF